MEKYIGKAYEFVYCSCGCGKTRSKYKISNGYEKKTILRTFIKGHENIGRVLSNLTKQKISQKTKGKRRSDISRKRISESHKGLRMNELNNKWKGDKVGYSGLHRWIRKYFLKPELCQICKEKSPKEVACITGIYNRELRNWAWLCVKCHKLWDNIIERNLHTIQQIQNNKLRN